MIETPAIVTTEPLLYAAIALVVPSSEIRGYMSAGTAEIKAVSEAQGIAASGPWFTHHHRRPTATFDFEICFPVATPVAPQGGVMPAVWAPTRVVRTVYHGTYAELPNSWGELQRWMQAENLAGREEFWEVYLTGPADDPDPAHWRTQLNWPLA